MKLTPELEEYKLTNANVAKIFCKRFKVLREAYRMSQNDVADTL